MKTMKFTLGLLAMVCWYAGCFMTWATEVDITKDPYNANTSMADVGGIINLAIQNLRAQGGGTIYIPMGDWKFTTPISIASNSSYSPGSIVIRGDGPHMSGWAGGTDLIFMGTGAVDAVTVDGSGGTYIPRVTIRDLAIDGGPGESGGNFTYGNRHGLVLKKISNFEISCVEIEGFVGDGILVDSCSYGSVRDADIRSVGIGIDCTSSFGIPPKGLQFDCVAVHQAVTAAFRDAPQLIGCTVEGENTDGLVYDSNSSPYVSTHDTYFENNNLTKTGEAADIYGQSSSISLALSGRNQFNTGTYSVAYRRVRGGFATVLRSDWSPWTDTPSPTGYWAAWNVTGTIYVDNSLNLNNPVTYPVGADNFTTAGSGSTANSYYWRYISESITTEP